MKLNYAPQAGLRRRKPDHRRERVAFWAGIAIVAAFELILMTKNGPGLNDLRWPWSDASGAQPAADDSALPSQPD